MATKRYNRNPANQTNFKLEIPGLEEVNYFVQTANLPGMSMAGVSTPFLNHQTNVPSNRIEYDEATMNFIVSEDYSNHTQIRLWMHAFAFGKKDGSDANIWGVTKDINLFLLDSNKVPRFKVVYFAAYPTSLGAIPLDSAVNSTQVLDTNVSFRYQYYDILPVT